METLETLFPHIDALEVLNARCWNDQPNDKAADLARNAGLLATAGSDAHTPVEVGRTYLILPAFSDADSFKEALKHARILGRRSFPLVHLYSRYATWRKLLGWTPPER